MQLKFEPLIEKAQTNEEEKKFALEWYGRLSQPEKTTVSGAVFCLTSQGNRVGIYAAQSTSDGFSPIPQLFYTSLEVDQTYLKACLLPCFALKERINSNRSAKNKFLWRFHKYLFTPEQPCSSELYLYTPWTSYSWKEFEKSSWAEDFFKAGDIWPVYRMQIPTPSRSQAGSQKKPTSA